MKLRTYKIVYLKNSFYDMVLQYPILAKLLYRNQTDIFDTKQIELLFMPIQNEKEKLLEILTQREDYEYYHGIHKLINPITEEVITIQMNEYDIKVTEQNQKHIIYDILKGFSKNFFMIEENL